MKIIAAIAIAAVLASSFGMASKDKALPYCETDQNFIAAQAAWKHAVHNNVSDAVYEAALDARVEAAKHCVSMDFSK